jgi:hypothetical protein
LPLQVGFRVERLAVEHLELNQMEMDRVHVAGGVGEGPDFGRPGFRILRDGSSCKIPAKGAYN